ncbi:YncE family protein [Candidatus Gracilibacteria bacterium]|jgi:YVTN family beta-propeller protein|nr:YncE family protein [Candidatus Gracilibacteria bacterium]
MKRLSLIAAIVLALSPFVISLVVFNLQNKNLSSQSYEEKVYVAIEEEGRVGVIDTQSRKLIKSIDLSEVQNNQFVKYTTHNVQVAPNGEMVLVTANVARGFMGEDTSEETEDITDGLFDKIFFIDPLTDTITGSLPIEIDSHLAHVVVNNEGTLAYAASQENNKIFVIDLVTKQITKTIFLEEGSEPHGLRLSVDDSKLYVALIGGKAIAEVNLRNDLIRNYPLSGSVIQTAVTPDGNYILGSVYETKKVAWINAKTDEQGYINLPEDAKGSVQLYPSPDSKYIYVANQGYYFEQPTGNTVYRIDIEARTVDQIIPAGDAPHGIVVDKAGRFVYVTNLLSKDVSIIDASTHQEVVRIEVGEMPNGISIWHKKMGGTP